MYQTGGLTRGIRSIRDRVAGFMQARTPAIIDAARLEWGVEDWQLPYFQVFDGIDPYKVVQFPAISVMASTDSNHQVVNILDDGAHETWPVYNVVMAVSVITPFDSVNEKYANPEFDSTVLLRDDLVALVQNLLVNDPGLLEPTEIQLLQNTINTTYQEPFQPNKQTKQWVASAFMGLSFKQRALTWQPPIGTADTVTIYEEGLPLT